jgi:hypothetical protein
MSDKNNLREEGFILACGFRGFSLWWAGSIALGLSMMAVEEGSGSSHVDRKQRARKGLGTRYNLQSHAPSDLLLPARPHLLKFPPPSKFMPPGGLQALSA